MEGFQRKPGFAGTDVNRSRIDYANINKYSICQPLMWQFYVVDLPRAWTRSIMMSGWPEGARRGAQVETRTLWLSLVWLDNAHLLTHLVAAR